MSEKIPNPNTIHPIAGYDKEIYVKPTIKNPNIIVGDFTYIADSEFESHVTHHYDFIGDKLIIGVMPEKFDPKTTPESEQRRIARDFVDHYMQPGKPCTLNFNAMGMLTPAFNEELYEYSRKKCCGLV